MTQNSIPSFFSSVSSVSICSRAIAHYNANGGDCMLATGSGGINFNASNIHVNITNCGMYSNGNINLSASNESVTVTNGGVGAVGGVTQSHTNDTITPTQVTGISPVTDPYATTASSWPTSCTGGSCSTRTVPTNGTFTLSPGVYPSGMTLDGTSCTTDKHGNVSCKTSNNVTYTMQPGVYYVNGNINVPSNSITLCADTACGGSSGVTIIPTGNSIVNVTGNSATFDIVAPSSGWNAGLAFWEPTSTGTNGFGTGNGATMDITGAIYIPDGTVQFSGNAGTSSSPECTQIVASSITLAGSNINFASGKTCSNVARRVRRETIQPVALVE